MSSETPRQKHILLKITELAMEAFTIDIPYGKVRHALNLAYGRSTGEYKGNDKGVPPTALLNEKKIADIRSARAAKARVIAAMTGAQIRAVRGLPEKMVDRVADDQLFGEVFSLTEIELVLAESGS